MASAQSIWQKLEQAAKQVKETADALARQTQATQHTGTSAPSATAPGSNDPGAAAQTPQAGADLSSPEMKALYRKLDVGGVQLGMTRKAAQAALQGRNRAFVPGSNSFVFADLPNTRFTSVIGFRTPESSAEVIQLRLTLLPMQPEVLSIFRSTQFNENNLPTIANTVAALRAKYGPETTIKIDSGNTTLFWIFDGVGRLVPKNRAEDKDYRYNLITNCASGEIQLNVEKNVPSGYVSSPICAPLTVLRAGLGEWDATRKNSHGQLLPPGMLMGMTVVASSYPMFAESVAATRNMILAAKDARQQKEKKAAEKNAATL